MLETRTTIPRRERDDGRRKKEEINVDDLYYTTWPDSWPEELKQKKKNEWLARYASMSLQTMYGLLMQDGPYPWYGINTLNCEAPIDPETQPDESVVRRFYLEQVTWNGVVTSWATDASVVARGVIRQDDINWKFNRVQHCPSLQAKLKFAAAQKIGSQTVDRLSDKIGKVSDFQDDLMKGAGDAAKGTGKVFKAVGDGAGDSPLLSFGAVVGLGALTILALTLRK